jgi:predicted AAA+ superfamily ATPase
MYFTDLSYYKSALDVIYGVGVSRLGVVENFVYLELVRKLKDSHTVHFWRKKSGTGVQFVLVNQANQMVTPIEITLRPSTTISQAMKSFYDSYSDRVEYGMLLNESSAEATTLADKSFLILPYPTI